MKVINQFKIPKKHIYEGRLINEVIFSDTFEGDLIDSFEGDLKELVDALNMINNQGIEKIDTQTYSYYRNGQRLKFSNFATSEKLFLIAYVANKNKEVIYLFKGITQLTKKSMRTFIKLFGNSSYINIVSDDEAQELYYNHLIASYKENKDD